MSRSRRGGRSRRSRHNPQPFDDSEDWTAPPVDDSYAPCTYPHPPTYEPPPEYCEIQPSRHQRQRGRQERSARHQLAECGGLPEYDENERSPFNDDGDVPEMTVRDLLSFSCPSGRAVVPYLVHRESTRMRPCPGVPGDVVAINRGQYLHFVVNVGDDFVIHKCNGEGLILCQRFMVVAGDDEADVKNDFDDRWDPYPPKEIVRRAYSKVHKKDGYNTVFANCEHFANWCRYGRSRSSQVDDAVSTITSSVASKGKKMVAAGGEGGLTVGSVIGSVAGGLVGGLLGVMKEAVTDEPDVPYEETIIRRRGPGHAAEVRTVQRKTFAESGAAVGGFVGGALGLVGGVVGGGILGLLAGIGDGTEKVAKKYGVDLGELSAPSRRTDAEE